MSVNKTEQGRQKRIAEREARAAATQARRDQTAEAQARSEQRKGPNPSSFESTMDQREAAAGLNLAGNDTMSGRRGGPSTPTMDQREVAAGLYNTTSGRDFFGAESGEAPPNAAENVDTFYEFGTGGTAPQPSSVQENNTGGEAGVETSGAQPINVLFCINGTPYNGYVLGQIGGEIT